MTTRKRKVTAEETTETVTVIRRKRRVDVEDTITTDTEPIRIAPGWHAMPALTGAAYRQQRAAQVRNTMFYLRDNATSGNDRETIQRACIILRAGPGATPAEAIHGRLT